MALYAWISPFLDSPPSNKSFVQLTLFSLMKSSNTALYRIVLRNTGFALFSACKDVLGVVGV
jgi:hypothetical protein